MSLPESYKAPYCNSCLYRDPHHYWCDLYDDQIDKNGTCHNFIRNKHDLTPNQIQALIVQVRKE